MKKTITGLAVLAIIFSACKKDSSTTTKTTREKILGKWTVVSQTDSTYYNGTLRTSAYMGVSTDYVDFRSDSKVYSNFQLRPDTSTYSILNDNAVVLDASDTMVIRTLTDNALVLYNKSVTGVNWSSSAVLLKK